MTQNAKPGTVFAVMMIASIYVIMLIGITRSHYFIGGAALERMARAPAAATYQLAATPESDRPVCLVPPPKVEQTSNCDQPARPLHRLLERRPD